MAEDKQSIKLINLSNYVRPNPIENKQKNWVLNGRNNEFYQYIIDRSNGSVTNKSILDSYETLVYGRGLGFTNGISGTNDWAKLQTILRPRELKKLVKDKVVFNEWSAQVIETRGKDLSSIEHIAKEKVVPSVANEDNEIESYWFSRDWSRINQNTPVEFPSFGMGGANQMFVSKPYSVGKIYYPDPVYIAGMQYMEMEEEISNLNINFIKSGLSAGYIINIPDGMSLTPEQKDKIEIDIKRKLTGSPNAGTFILNFSGRDQEPITVTVFPINDNIHKQWEFLTKESRQQILTSHKCTSPAIVGVISSTGFSNTAEEMQQAREDLLMYVIKPIQDSILEDLEEILVAYGINLDLVFKPLTEVAEAPTQLSNHVCMSNENYDDIKMWDILDSYALDMSEDYDLTDGKEYELQLSANQTSEQDSKLWKIRYAYVEGTSKSHLGKKSRSFCLRMRALEKTGKVFRKEDIELMSMQGVNGQFAHSGGKYDIFLYGGGVNCYHRWERRIFKKKLNADGTPKKGGALASTTEVNVNEARRQGAKIPVNSPDVAIAEIDKPNKGSLK